MGMPLVACDIYRNFPLSLEFSGVPDYKEFMCEAQRVYAKQSSPFEDVGDDSGPRAHILEISPGDNNHEPVQTRILLDSEKEMLRVDSVGDIVAADTRYKAVLHLEGEQKHVYLVTGLPGNKIG